MWTAWIWPFPKWWRGKMKLQDGVGLEQEQIFSGKWHRYILHNSLKLLKLWNCISIWRNLFGHGFRKSEAFWIIVWWQFCLLWWWGMELDGSFSFWNASRLKTSSLCPPKCKTKFQKWRVQEKNSFSSLWANIPWKNVFHVQWWKDQNYW